MQTGMDFFPGAGGFSEGFRRAGFKIILAIDNEPRMLAAYRANHPGTEVWERDVLTIDPSELPDADVIIGSPPCQDFSTANVNRDPEKGMVLVNWMLDTVKAKKPHFWVMENVPGVKRHLPNWIPTIKTLNAVEYGVPQTRKRCFAGNYPIPLPTHNNGPQPQRTLDGRVLKPWVTVRDAIWDLVMDTGGGRPLTSRQMGKINEHRKRIGLKSAPDPIDKPSRTIMASEAASTEKNIVIPVAGEEFNPDYESVPLDPDKPSKTVTTLWRCDHRLSGGRMGRYVVPDVNWDSPATTVQSDPRLWPRGHHKLRKVFFRRTTVRERARPQSFPDSYKFIGSLSWQSTQIGEAVPPLLAQRIAEDMLKHWDFFTDLGDHLYGEPERAREGG